VDGKRFRPQGRHPAIAAAVIALTAGMRLQETVMHAIAAPVPPRDQPPRVAPSRPNIAGGLTLLAPAGLAIAIVGGLDPATWAAASRTTIALRAECPFGRGLDDTGTHGSAVHIESSLLLLSSGWPGFLRTWLRRGGPGSGGGP
jgi:hypothetical protein